MTLDEAFDCLRREIRLNQPSSDLEQARKALRQSLGAIAAQTVFAEHLRTQIVEEVLAKVEDRALAGTLPEVGSARSYLTRSVKNRSIDLARRLATAAKAQEELLRRSAAAQEAAQREAEREATWPHLERLFAIVLRSMSPHHRASNEAAWATLCMVHRDGMTLREAVARRLVGKALTDRDLATEVQRMHKAHQRLRDAIHDELKARAGNEATREADALAQTLLNTLRRRCPIPRSEGVTPGEVR